MSLDATRHVWATHQTSGAHLVVLLAYADAMNDDGRAWISIPTLARRCGIGCHKHARRVVHELVEAGALVSIGPHPDHRYKGAIVYRLATSHPGSTDPGLQTPGLQTPGVNEKLPGEFVQTTRVGRPPNPSRDPLERQEGSGSMNAAGAERTRREGSEGKPEVSQEESLSGGKGEVGKVKFLNLGSNIGLVDDDGWQDVAYLAGATDQDSAEWVVSYLVGYRQKSSAVPVRRPDDVKHLAHEGRAALEKYKKQRLARKKTA